VLALSVQGAVHFWDCFTQSALPLILYCNVRSIDALDWSIDARLAAWTDNQIVLYPLPYASLTTRQIISMQTIATGTMRSGNVGVLRWSPDGSHLLAGASNGALMGWYGKKLASMWKLAEPGQKVNHVAWSPDGELLAAALRDARVVVWDAHARKALCTWTKLPAMPRTLSISLTGRITVASTEKRLLSGFSADVFPSATCPGQLLVAWSPLQSELVTLEEHKETSLMLWRE
jgi:WD40 repeat protein